MSNPAHSEKVQNKKENSFRVASGLPYLPTPPLGQDMTQGQFF